jgi:hypothetical protein
MGLCHVEEANGFGTHPRRIVARGARSPDAKREPNERSLLKTTLREITWKLEP